MDKGSNWLLLSVHDVGYKVFVPLPLLRLPEGEAAQIYTYLHVRDDLLQLYGFEDRETLALFETLISVSGLGPKLGIVVLSVLSNAEIARALETEDIAPFTRVPGIGKKLAQRLVLELKGVLAESKAVPQEAEELRDALASLGYKPAEVARFLEAVPKELSLSEQIRWVLSQVKG